MIFDIVSTRIVSAAQEAAVLSGDAGLWFVRELGLGQEERVFRFEEKVDRWCLKDDNYVERRFRLVLRRYPNVEV